MSEEKKESSDFKISKEEINEYTKIRGRYIIVP